MFLSDNHWEEIDYYYSVTRKYIKSQEATSSDFYLSAAYLGLHLIARVVYKYNLCCISIILETKLWVLKTNPIWNLHYTIETCKNNWKSTCLKLLHVLIFLFVEAKSICQGTEADSSAYLMLLKCVYRRKLISKRNIYSQMKGLQKKMFLFDFPFNKEEWNEKRWKLLEKSMFLLLSKYNQGSYSDLLKLI